MSTGTQKMRSWRMRPVPAAMAGLNAATPSRKYDLYSTPRWKVEEAPTMTMRMSGWLLDGDGCGCVYGDNDESVERGRGR